MEFFLKASAVLFIFYSCYKLFLQKETFFESNRWFLLVGLITAFSVPFITIPIYITKVAPQETGLFSYETLQASSAIETTGISWMQFIGLLYIIGFLYFFIKFFIQIYSMFRLIINSEKEKVNQHSFVKIEDDISPFSFFNYIVYNPNQYSKSDLQQIIVHEKIHANQFHSLDILITHVAVIINWFNPLFWFYKNDLQQNLEFIADHEAQKKSECQKTYQHLLLKTTMPNYKMALANNFYNSLIKNRIVMLHKNRSKNRNQLKAALVIPIIALFLLSFSTKEIITYENPYYNIETAIPEITIGEVVDLMITKDLTDGELKEMTENMKKNDVTLKFKGVKRNSNGEITDINIVVKTKKSSATYKQDDLGPITPIKITIKDNNSISIGNGHEMHDYNFSYNIKVDEHEPHVTSGTSYVIRKSNDDSKVHETHSTKSGNIFVYSSDDVDHENDVHVTADKIVIRNDGEVHEIKNVHKDKSIFVISGGAGKSTVIRADTIKLNGKVIVKDKKVHVIRGDAKSIFELKGDDSNNKEVIIIKDKDGNYVKEWIDNDSDDNIWISGDDDKMNIIKFNKGNSKLFFYGDKDSTPLFFIDGKEVTKEDIDNLDSDKIEKMEVLKGDSATKKYGDKGKAGVILITTKDN